MHRIDLTPGRPLLAARIAVMAVLPADGSPIGYATLALACGEDCGELIGDLVDHGMINAMQVDGAMRYGRALHGGRIHPTRSWWAGAPGWTRT